MKTVIFLSFTLITFSPNLFGQVSIDNRRLLNESFWSEGSVYGSRDAYTKLASRNPSDKESASISYAEKLMANNKEIKVILLIDNGDVVFEKYNDPVVYDSMLHGYSVTKTITSFAIGAAICKKIIDLNEKLGNTNPIFIKTGLENATVKNLLMMASGTTSADADSNFKIFQNIIDDYHFNEKSIIEASVKSTILQPRKGIFKNFQPGEIFDYKNSDTAILGFLLNYKTNLKGSDFVYENVLLNAGINGKVSLAEDKNKVFFGAYGARMMAHDWGRLAVWSREKIKEDSCMGNYLKEATKTQISNKEKRFARWFNGYGYQIWTENSWSKNSYWALGYGGQKIAWNHSNDKIMVAFSTSENWHPEAARLYELWSTENSK
jgi:CubicO group peptidase (beta-lactamase class C family)